MFVLCVDVGCIGIYSCYVFPLDWSLDHYAVPFLISHNFILKSICPIWRLLLQISFAFHLHGIYFSILSLSVYMCLEVWSGFLVDSIYMGLVYFIHSAGVCLLVGAFNTFTFKEILDIHVPIDIFLTVLSWFINLFSSLVFIDYITPFNICCKAGLVVLNSFNFCLSENLFYFSINFEWDPCQLQ